MSGNEKLAAAVFFGMLVMLWILVETPAGAPIWGWSGNERKARKHRRH